MFYFVDGLFNFTMETIAVLGYTPSCHKTKSLKYQTVNHYVMLIHIDDGY